MSSLCNGGDTCEAERKHRSSEDRPTLKISKLLKSWIHTFLNCENVQTIQAVWWKYAGKSFCVLILHFFLSSAEWKHPKECFLSPCRCVEVSKRTEAEEEGGEKKGQNAQKKQRQKHHLAGVPAHQRRVIETIWSWLQSMQAGFPPCRMQRMHSTMMTAIKKRCRSQLAGRGRLGGRFWIPEVKGIL